jgi:hypothetical protein
MRRLFLSSKTQNFVIGLSQAASILVEQKIPRVRGDRMDVTDRRKHPRCEGQFQVDLLNMGDDPTVSPFEAIVPGTALDVSRQGMRIKAAYNVPIGAFLSVILYNEGGESLCLCEVVWKREEDGEILYGVFTQEWSKLDPKLEKALGARNEETSDERSSGFSPAVAQPA